MCVILRHFSFIRLIHLMFLQYGLWSIGDCACYSPEYSNNILIVVLIELKTNNSNHH